MIILTKYQTDKIIQIRKDIEKMKKENPKVSVKEIEERFIGEITGISSNVRVVKK